MADNDAVLGRKALGDDRSVTRLGIALHAQQRGRTLGWQLVRYEVERCLVEDLPRVSGDVLRREHGPRALALAPARVLGVLEVAQLGCRRELLVVLVGHAGAGERGLQAGRVRPRVLRAADAAPLADVDQQP